MIRLLVWAAVLALVVAFLRPRRPARVAAPARDPWEVLGVDRDASAEEITQAYRARLKEYHPDRVADLGPELRALAHEKTLVIQQAFEALRAPER